MYLIIKYSKFIFIFLKLSIINFGHRSIESISIVHLSLKFSFNLGQYICLILIRRYALCQSWPSKLMVALTSFREDGEAILIALVVLAKKLSTVDLARPLIIVVDTLSPLKNISVTPRLEIFMCLLVAVALSFLLPISHCVKNSDNKFHSYMIAHYLNS